MLNAIELDFDFGIPSKKLKEVAKKMLPTVSKDAIKGCLQSMQITRKGNIITAYSTDGYRLSEYTFESPGKDYNVLINAVYIKELKKKGKLESYKAMSESYETGCYPRCEQLIPKYQDTIQINGVKELIKNIKYYRDKKHTLVKLDLAKGTIFLEGECSHVVHAGLVLVNFTSEQLVDHYSSDLLIVDQIAFNINYFVDALKAIGSDTIQVSTNLHKPHGLKRLKNPDDKEFSVYLMPVQLRKQPK